MRIHVPSSTCAEISFIVQGQLCPLTCAERRDLSNHTRMSMVQSRAPKKKTKNHETLTWKFPWKSCSTTDQPCLSSDHIKDPKSLCKNFSHQNEAYYIPSKRETKWGEKSEKQGEEREQKVKVKTAVSLLNPKILLPAHAWTLQANSLAIWIRRPWSVWPVHGFVVIFSSL